MGFEQIVAERGKGRSIVGVVAYFEGRKGVFVFGRDVIDAAGWDERAIMAIAVGSGADKGRLRVSPVINGLILQKGVNTNARYLRSEKFAEIVATALNGAKRAQLDWKVKNGALYLTLPKED